jgi:hypothetical protein
METTTGTAGRQRDDSKPLVHIARGLFFVADMDDEEGEGATGYSLSTRSSFSFVDIFLSSMNEYILVNPFNRLKDLKIVPMNLE